MSARMVFRRGQTTSMKNITDPRWIKIKGVLFLILGLLASGLLVVEHPELRVILLLGVAIWCFCRFYYFAFYVIEHYVDATYRFSGLLSFVRYLWSRRH
jgi:hypothetical protein